MLLRLIAVFCIAEIAVLAVGTFLFWEFPWDWDWKIAGTFIRYALLVIPGMVTWGVYAFGRGA